MKDTPLPSSTFLKSGDPKWRGRLTVISSPSLELEILPGVPGMSYNYSLIDGYQTFLVRQSGTSGKWLTQYLPLPKLMESSPQTP